MKHKILILAMLLCVLLGLTANVQADTLYDEIEEPAIGGKYYLCATIDGVDHYYRVTNSGASESVTDTTPYSLYVTEDPDDKNIKEFTLEALGAGFFMGYPSGDKTHKIYSFDANNDDLVDTGLNSGLDLDRHCFFWDGTNKQIFRMIDDEKYVLVVKMLRSVKTGADELHMLSIPAEELEGEEPVYPVRFVIKHVCQFSDELTGNQYSHWYPCSCGAKKDLQLHEVDGWTVTQEPSVGVEGSRTGVCTVCGETAVEGIPALKDKNEPAEPVEGEEAEQEQAPATISPVVITVAAALFVLGIVILIFGKKREKK